MDKTGGSGSFRQQRILRSLDATQFLVHDRVEKRATMFHHEIKGRVSIVDGVPRVSCVSACVYASIEHGGNIQKWQEDCK